MVQQRFSHTMKRSNDVGDRKNEALILDILFFSVSPMDLDRIETTFRDLTSGTNELHFNAFKRDVFANFLPEQLASVCIEFKLLSQHKFLISFSVFINFLITHLDQA